MAEPSSIHEQRRGAELIAAERTRQATEEGWSPEHDAEHTGYELTRAAICYANAAYQGCVGQYDRDSEPHEWPWTGDWWNPSDDRVRNLVKAGALIAAEIDRLKRVEWERYLAKVHG